MVTMTMAATPAPAGNSPSSAAAATPSDSSATMIIFICSAVGILFSIFQFYLVSLVGQEELGDAQARGTGSIKQQNLLSESDRKEAASRADLKFIYETIREGAQAFLWAEY
jgi:hypothetical protein